MNTKSITACSIIIYSTNRIFKNNKLYFTSVTEIKCSLMLKVRVTEGKPDISINVTRRNRWKRRGEVLNKAVQMSLGQNMTVR